MTLSTQWMAQFDGTHIETKTAVSAVLGTAGDDGWAHAAYLSCGEILAMPPDRVRLCLWPASGTARNIENTGRASLHVAAEGVVWEARLGIVEIRKDEQGFMVEFEVVETLRHRAPYAHVRAMIDFELLDLERTLERWRGQITRLRQF